MCRVLIQIIHRLFITTILMSDNWPNQQVLLNVLKPVRVTAQIMRRRIRAVPVAEFLAGFELKGNLLPRLHLSPLADIVRVISSRTVDV